MKIIDCRCRPATESFMQATLDVDPAHIYRRFDLNVPSIQDRSLSAFMHELDEAGITLACAVTRWSFGDQREDAITPPEEVARLVEQYPEKLYGTVAIDGYHIRKSLDIIEKFVVNGPVQAASLEPGMSKHYADDKELYPLYEYLSEMDIPLFMMTGGGNGPYISYTNPEHLDRMLVDFPKLTVIGMHGCVPHAFEDIMVAFRRRNYFPCPDVYVPDSPFGRIYAEAGNSMIKDQLVFGSAYPLITLKEGVDSWMRLPFKDSVLENIMWKNAARALKLNWKG